MSISDSELEEIINEIADELCNSDAAITSAIAETNATGWGLDEYSNPRVTNQTATEATLDVDLTLSGDQDDEKGFMGDTIEVTVKATLAQTNDGWELSEYNIETWSRNDDDEEVDDVDVGDD